MIEAISWTASGIAVVAIVVPYALHFHRMAQVQAAAKAEAADLGFDRPTAQFPYVDPTVCIGCGTCVMTCPEGDVLGVVNGVSTVINGLRCIGLAHCEEECPVGAITVGLGDMASRTDIPLLDENHQSSVPGVHVVGEASGLALIRFAVQQGAHAMRAIADDLAGEGAIVTPGGSGYRSGGDTVSDVVVVGAGPAGLSAALEARRRGLTAVVLEQESDLGGSVLHYPRRKLVLTQPAELPLWGNLDRGEYTKEDLLEILQGCVERFSIPIRYGQRVTGVAPDSDGYVVRTETGEHRTRRVVMATGKRGTPRKLGVDGEERSKVMYRLVDAAAYRDQRILVVGGGDSAVEAAIGLGREGNNHVTISYRRDRFLRIKQKNQQKIEQMIGSGRVDPLFESNVAAIGDDRVEIATREAARTIENDFVFVFIGGIPPLPLFRSIGMRFGGDD